MMQRRAGRSRRQGAWVNVLTVAALAVAGTVMIPAAATPAYADAPATVPQTAVTADPLPTVQIDGVVWSQAVSGNRVFAGGAFDTARPAGAAPGVDTVERKNLLAYDITTGQLDTSFVPKLNGSALVVAVSPDGRTLYVGGNFTFANGNARDRIVAYDLSTGQVVQSFAPSLDAGVKAIYATNTTVYVGGSFTTANGVARSRMAAFNATDGALLGWSPSSDNSVNSFVMTPDGSKLIVAGSFVTFNGVAAKGLQAVDPATGSTLPWAATSVVRNGGSDASIYNLSTDGTSVYGTGYVFNGSQGNLEGVFSADPSSGQIKWIEDCHGDTYGAYAMQGAVYTVGHAHMCDNIDGFPEVTPRAWWRAQAFTTDATNTIHRNTVGSYANWAGYAAPSPLAWYPALEQGAASGQGQAAWSVTGNGDYVVLGGEFPTVNSVKQQGLVRFAVRSAAPNKVGPAANALLKPSLTSSSPNTIRVGWQTTWDRDDQALTYKVYRDGKLTTPVYQVTTNSRFWNKPFLSFVDTNLTAGRTYSYRVFAYDPNGNYTASGSATFTVGTASTTSAYSDRVVADGATQFWRLNEPTGTVAFDSAGGYDAVTGATLVRGIDGPIAGETASKFDGTATSTINSQYNMYGPRVFSAQAWFRTTTTTGGEILGYGTAATGLSGTNDRAVFMTNAGKLVFDLYPGAHKSVTSPATYNDGQWHQVTATFDGTMMSLLVDGVAVASRNDGVYPWWQNGYWRIGGDKLTGMSGVPSSAYFNGDIANVAIYPSALSRQKVADQYVLAGRTTTVPAAPADLYGAAVYGDDPDLYWRLGDASGSTTAADSSRTLNTGDYRPGSSANATSGALAGVSDSATQLNGTSAGVASRAQIQGPNTFTVEAWVKSTTRTGGRIVGFSSTQTGTNGTNDRMIYLQNDGKAVFTVTSGTRVNLTSPAALNDGQWHHVAGTLGGGTMRFYVDGVAVGTATAASPQSYTGWWRAGSGTTGGSTSSYLAGSLDEVAVYSTALAGERVAAHYFAGKTGQTNQAPVADFAATPTNRSVAFDALASSDADGTITAYAWDFGDGSTGTGATATHLYAKNGTYPVKLTVTDSGGLTSSTTKNVTVELPNSLPTAAFGFTAADLAVAFDGSASSDPDQTVVGYAWNFGDGSSQPTSSSPTASHTFPATGTYQVTLTVTDSEGGTGSLTRDVAVLAANVAPVGAFTSTVSALSVSVDGSTSTDSDGSIVNWAWDFGDGQTATGATATHAYTASGTYPVKLVVTDDRGGTQEVTRSIIVWAPSTTNLATDTFGRVVANGLGSADLGGAWSVSGSTANYSVNGSAGVMNVPASTTTQGFLNTVRGTDVEVNVDVQLDKVANGGGAYVSVVGRRLNNNDYRAKARVLSNGTVSISLTKVVAGAESTIATQTVSGLTVGAGSVVKIRFQATGTVATTGSTALNAKVWAAGAAEPAAWQVTGSDTTAALQQAGGVGLAGYVSASTTNGPVAVTFDNLAAGTVQPAG